MKPILFPVFRFIRTFYLVVYNLMQGALFLYITSVLLSKVIFQGTGTVKFCECLLVIRTFRFTFSTTRHQLRTVNLNYNCYWTTCVVRFVPLFKSPLTIYTERTSHQDSNGLYFSPIKETSAAKPCHERMLPPNVFFNWSYIQR